VDAEVVKKLQGKIVSVRAEYSRRVSDGNYGSTESGMALEVRLSPEDSLKEVGAAAQALCEAFVNLQLKPAAISLKEEAESKPAEVQFAPPEAEAPAKDGEEGHTRIARFTLEARPDDKFLLSLYPRIGSKAGQYPELKFTANREDMWAIIGPEWDNDWKVPCDKEVDWLADWRLGREKTGPKAKPGSRYKDLVAIHGA
jgi:hypothetical protein